MPLSENIYILVESIQGYLYVRSDFLQKFFNGWDMLEYLMTLTINFMDLIQIFDINESFYYQMLYIELNGL